MTWNRLCNCIPNCFVTIFSYQQQGIQTKYRRNIRVLVSELFGYISDATISYINNNTLTKY